MQVKKNASILAQALVDKGFSIVSGGTDNHSMLLDLRQKYPDLTGKVAENALVAADITANKNKVHDDERSAFQTSGLRLGTAAMTTRGCKEDMMLLCAELIDEVLSDPENEQVIKRVREKVNETMKELSSFRLLNIRIKRYQLYKILNNNRGVPNEWHTFLYSIENN